MGNPKRPAGRSTRAPSGAEKVGRAHGASSGALAPGGASLPADGLPTLAEARRRLAAWRHKSLPYLAPEVLDAAPDVPELVGPATYRKPCRAP